MARDLASAICAKIQSLVKFARLIEEKRGWEWSILKIIKACQKASKTWALFMFVLVQDAYELIT